MKTPEDLLSAFSDELYGFALSAFAEEHATRGNLSAQGRWMKQRMIQARSLLLRIHAFVTESKPEPKPAPSGTPAQTPARKT